jgi:hypothetical protein
LTVSLLAWFELLLGLNGSWVCLVLAGVLVAGVTGVWLSTEVFVLGITFFQFVANKIIISYNLPSFSYINFMLFTQH